MSVAVRYFSKLGNTKQIAEAIAEGAQTTAVSIVDEPALAEYVDVLFLGGAPYANIMDPHRTVHALRKTLRENGIDVEEEHFFAHMLNIKGRKEAAKEFGKKYSA